MKEDHDNVLDALNENNPSKLDKKYARKMVWRTRLSIGFTVIRTLLLIFLLFILYMIPVEMYYDMSGKQAGFDRLVTTFVETRNPGVEVYKLSSKQAEINPFLTQSTTLKLYRNVGEWDVVVGEVVAKKRLFGDLNVTLNFDAEYLNESPIRHFVIPPGMLDEKNADRSSGSTEHLGDQLKNIDDGHVAQAQFSVKETMPPKELLEKLNGYDVHVFRMPVYGGELTEVNDISYSKSGQLTSTPSLLLRPQKVYDENNRHSSSMGMLSDETLEKSIDQFYQDMEWLIENGNYKTRDIDQKRLDYIHQNGMQVYGAVVTGPVREIEKLMDEEQFHQFHLGGIEIWNWDE